MSHAAQQRYLNMRLYQPWRRAVISEHEVLSAMMSVKDTAEISEHDVVSALLTVEDTAVISEHEVV